MSAPAIQAVGLTRRFKDVVAVDGLDLTVGGPGVFGFLGANGAGKTTTIRMLVGLIHPSAGEIRLFGERMDGGNHAVRRRLGYLPQDPAFYGWMTGLEYLLHTADLFGIPRREAHTRAAELLERSGLSQAARRKVGGYSGGMKQRLGIAQALINRPDLVMLDEPASALDPVGRLEVLDLIATLGNEVTVFMSSHILADIERVCAEVAILHQGRLLVHEPTKSLKARAVRPAFDLAVRGQIDPLTQRLSSVPGVVAVERLPRLEDDAPDVARLRVSVQDVRDGEQLLPQALAAAGVGLVALNQVTPSLEEVFIALVGARNGREAA